MSFKIVVATSAIAGAFVVLLLAAPSYGQAEKASEVQAAVSASADDTAIRPFNINFPDADLVDLRRRIAATRWPERETVTDASQGVQLATMQKLASYWATDYDWRKCEAKLNALPMFVTNIDGLEIHFIHVRSKNPNALPIIITHGWPGSIIEQLKIIGPLTDPTAYGGKAEDSFDVVIPSLPGYGFSGKPTAPGWTPLTIAKAWATLMQRLGDVGWNRSRHVGVDAEQSRGLLQGHHLRDGIAPVAALRHEARVAEALHQHDPGTRDAGRVPAGRGRLA